MSRLHQDAGTTLLEVVVALGILATTYVALLEVHSGAIRLSRYGRQITIAALLAQNRMEEIEWEMEKDGFPDMEKTDEGKFDEDGFPAFSWQLRISKVELPLGAALEQMVGNLTGSDGEEGSTASKLLGQLGSAGGAGGLQDMLRSQLGTAGSSAASSLLNPEMLRGQVEGLAKTLEESIREVQLTVLWGKGEEGERLVVTTHVVRVPQAPSSSGAAPGGSMATSTPGMTPGMPGMPGGSAIPGGLAPGLINKNVPFGGQTGKVGK